MAMWRPRYQLSHLKVMLSSFRSSPFSLTALDKTPFLQTLPARSSFYLGHRHPVFLASLHRPASCGILLYPIAIKFVHSFSSVSLGQELDLKDQDDQQHEPPSEDKSCQDHLSDAQQAKQARTLPVKAYLLGTSIYLRSLQAKNDNNLYPPGPPSSRAVLRSYDVRGDKVLPVKAYFLGTSIDLRSLQAQNAYNLYPHVPPSYGSTNYLVLRYNDVRGDKDVELDSVNESKCHYVVAFQYGSVVLFNVSDYEADGYLKIVEKHVSGLLLEMRKDEYAVVENPTQVAWMQGGVDNIMLKNLTIDGICTIGNVLGQSIALDYYNHQVDEMIAEFTDINQCMAKTGTFTMQRKKLFQLVGKTKLNMAHVILKLRLLERTEIAWINGNYAQIWEYLQDEYEVTKRFKSLDYKLKFVEHNISFFKECLETKKSTLLSWIIIILISIDGLISVFGMVL